MSRVLFIVCDNGSFAFSRDMQQGDIQNDDVFFNYSTKNSMTVSSSGLPFRAGHEIHLDIFQSIFPTLSSLGSLVVDIYSSLGLFNYLCVQLCLILSFFLLFFISLTLFCRSHQEVILEVGNYVRTCQNFQKHNLLLELNQDLYLEVM
jgi:hypothetical protein